LWDTINFQKLQHDGVTGRVFGEEWEGNSQFYRVLDSIASPYISVDNDWESFYKSRTRKFRKGMNNKINRVKKLGDVTIEHINTLPILQACLPDLFSVSSRSWKARYGTAITSNPRDMKFYRDLTASAGSRGWIDIWFLKHKGVAIACEYHMVYENRVMILRGDSDESYKDISPGSFLEYNIIKHVFQESIIQDYDFCGANYKYMRNWTDKVKRHDSILYFNSRLIPRLLGFAECKLLPAIKRLTS
jgi:CelD/BcsL family acetyltransferase involved in cellulose biosynthesis